MKILHVLQSPIYSGAENVACQIIKIFEEEIDMAYTSQKGENERILKEKGIHFIPQTKLCYTELKKIIKSYKPDLIHAHDFKASVLSAILSKKTPVISHIHGKKKNMTRLSLHLIIYLLFINKFKRIISVSKSIVEEFYFNKLLIKKSIVLNNVVDIFYIENQAKEIVNEKFDIVFIGRIAEEKNPMRLLKISKFLVDTKKEIKIGIFGNGEMFDQLKNSIDEKYRENIILKGFQKNPFPYLKNAKALLLTSNNEGLPMVVLEAMALGIPVVSTPVDGVKEIIENEVDGFYSGNDVEIINYILSVLENDEIRFKIGKKAKEKAIKICRLESYKNKLNDIYLK